MTSYYKMFITILILYFSLHLGRAADEEPNVCKSDEAYGLYINIPSQNKEECFFNPDIGKDMTSIVKQHNYPITEYTVTTKDGYILTLFRIPGNGQPVLLMHGIGASSLGWINKDKRSLAYFLADHGYDVWMGNFRGSLYSRKHLHLPTTLSDEPYWSFSLYHLGVYDLPAIIDQVNAQKTNPGPILYIGHSMGTTAFYIYASEKEEEANRNILAVISLAPIAYVENSPSLQRGSTIMLNIFLPLIRFCKRHGLEFCKMYGLFTTDTKQKSYFGDYVKSHETIKIVRDIFEHMFGIDKDQLLPEDIPLVMDSWPSGISLNTLLNYVEFHTKKAPVGFDYGPEDNTKIYGKNEPPIFDFTGIKLPMYLFYGPNDVVADETDVMDFFKNLATKQKDIIKISESVPFNHLNFVYAKDAVISLFEPILKILNQFPAEDVNPNNDNE